MLLVQNTYKNEPSAIHHLGTRSLFLLLCLAFPGFSLRFDCPVSTGVETVSEEVCGRYNACEWIGTRKGSRCLLRQGVGYRIRMHECDDCSKTPLECSTNRSADAEDDENFREIHTQSLRRPTRSKHGTTTNKNRKSTDNSARREKDWLLLERKLLNVTMYGDDVNELRGEIDYYSCHTARITLRDAKNHRYEVPLELENRRGCTNSKLAYAVDHSIKGSENILFRLMYSNSTIVIPDTLIYSQQFIETRLIFSTTDVYGFGENNHDRFRHDVESGTTWTMFARDQPPGDNPQNLYGTHPFFIGIAQPNCGHSFGVFFLNSNAMEYRFQRVQSKTILTFRTVGGILDMFFTFGSSPLDVVEQYTRLVGRPIMPAYWGLGYQLSRFGYQNTSHIRAVYERNRAVGIPQDIQYADIDYMDGRRDFTFDQTSFGQLKELVENLTVKNVHFALIYDPAIAIDFTKYPPVDDGVKDDVFVTWMNHSLVPENQCEGCGDYVVGRVWPRNRTLFPDFFKAKTIKWWTKQMYSFYKKLGKPDGFWIDMNEPSNFDTNIKTSDNNLICPDNKYENPPYPTAIVREPSNFSKKISDKTICMSSKHTADGKSTRLIGVIAENGNDNTLLHYDAHNLYGWSEFRATRQAMDYILEGKRGILVGRSTYPGSGRWGSHWLGDNTSRWPDLRRSIVGLLEFNMFGIPYVGADICGFNGNTTQRLCLRWTQLGAFYPFCRNHNTDNGQSQDPSVWPEVIHAAREALGLRYRLLPVLYTLLYRAQQRGSMVVRPIPFQFPNEQELRGVDAQFMWGDSIMVAPVVRPGLSLPYKNIDNFDQVEVVFPPGGWFHLLNGSAVAITETGIAKRIYNVYTDDMIPVFVRNGSIITIQQNESTTHRSRQNAFEVHVFGPGPAHGELFWDDGESRHTVENGLYHLNLYRYLKNTLSIHVIRNGTCYMHDPYIRKIAFYGVSQRPRAVIMDKHEIDPSTVHYDNQVVTLAPIELHMSRDHTIHLLLH